MRLLGFGLKQLAANYLQPRVDCLGRVASDQLHEELSAEKAAIDALIPAAKFPQMFPNLGPSQLAKKVYQIHLVGEELVAHKAGHHHASPMTARSAVQAMGNVLLD